MQIKLTKKCNSNSNGLTYTFGTKIKFPSQHVKKGTSRQKSDLEFSNKIACDQVIYHAGKGSVNPIASRVDETCKAVNKFLSKKVHSESKTNKMNHASATPNVVINVLSKESKLSAKLI